MHSLYCLVYVIPNKRKRVPLHYVHVWNVHIENLLYSTEDKIRVSSVNFHVNPHNNLVVVNLVKYVVKKVLYNVTRN